MPRTFPRSSVPTNFRSRDGEHEGARVLSHADAVGPGGVDDENTAGAGRIDVDVVDARPGARDDSQVRRSGEQPCVDPGRAAHEDGIRIGHLCREYGGRPAGPRVDRPVGFGAKQFESRCGQIVRDDDLQCDFAGPILRT